MAKILIVDEAINMPFYNEILGREGHELSSTDSAEVALEMLQIEKPHIIAIDPVASDTELKNFASKIRENKEFENIKLILLTTLRFSEKWSRTFVTNKQDHLLLADNMRHNLDLIKNYKISNYLQKPFNKEDFVKVINQTLLK